MSGTDSGTDSGYSQDARPQLHGWKDIATYFGRSVRTVQRWERDFGLPVRRYGMGRAELVHAYLDDLELWKSSAEAQAARWAGVRDDDAAAMAPIPPPPPRSRLPIALVLLAALLVIVSVAVWLATGSGGTNRSPARPDASALEPGGWDFRGNALIVKNADGHVLWRHEFPFRLPGLVPPLHLSHPGEPVRIEDVDGDGHYEVLAISVPADGRGEAYRFHAFSHTGRLLWDYARAGSVVFGDTTYVSPFLARHFYLTPRGPRGSAMWLVSNHRPWFPSVMEKVELDGTLMSEYWSAGYVTMVWEGVVAGRRVVLVGARNNESQGASLAMLDAARPAGSAPAEEARYQCRSCPPGRPLRFVKFQKPARLRALGGTSPVLRISVDSNSRISVWVAPAHDTEAQPRPEVIYTLDAGLRPLSIGLNDAFDASVRALAGRKLIPEPPATPAANEVQSVRWWDGSGFIDLAAPAPFPRK
jgi:hypothetical protein